MLDNNQSSQNAISHRELNDFLIKAKRERCLINKLENNQSEENEEFNELIKNWTETSKKILLMMNMEQKTLTENINPRSLMAYGAMGAHINMALQALKATESDQ